jgi:hypothetical protein
LLESQVSALIAWEDMADIIYFIQQDLSRSFQKEQWQSQIVTACPKSAPRRFETWRIVRRWPAQTPTEAQTIVLKCCELCEIVCEGGLLMSILEYFWALRTETQPLGWWSTRNSGGLGHTVPGLHGRNRRTWYKTFVPMWSPSGHHELPWVSQRFKQPAASIPGVYSTLSGPVRLTNAS